MSATIITTDCLDALRDMPDASVDAVVTDPPYGLSNTTPAQVAETITRWVSGERDYLPSKVGFMGHEWDGFVPPPAVWDECLRVLKPGGHLLAFAGSRTQDLMGLAVRLAGFEIRDSIAWLHSQGFPKAKSQLKPAHEPIILARKPMASTVAANVLEHGTGALNIDACRIGTDATSRTNRSEMGYHGGNIAAEYTTGSTSGRWPANVVLDESQAAELDRQSGVLANAGNKPGSMRTGRVDGAAHERTSQVPTYSGGPSVVYNDQGGASRFFYVAKAPKSERPSYTPPVLRLRDDLTPEQVDHVRARLAEAGVQVD